MPRTQLARLLEAFQLGEQQTGVSDRVDANVVAAAVSRPSLQRDIDPREAAMSRANREPRRLCDDRSVSADAAGEKRAHAETLVLLIDDGGDNDLSIGSRCRLQSSGTHCCESALHVGGAATVDAIGAQIGTEWVVHHSLDADDIE